MLWKIYLYKVGLHTIIMDMNAIVIFFKLFYFQVGTIA